MPDSPTSTIPFQVRLGFESADWLIDMVIDADHDCFISQLISTLAPLQPKILRTTDLWMNDETQILFNSNEGKFLLSIDIWNIAFLMADKNQPIIHTIAELLKQSGDFREVEFR